MNFHIDELGGPIVTDLVFGITKTPKSEGDTACVSLNNCRFGMTLWCVSPFLLSCENTVNKRIDTPIWTILKKL